MVPGVERFAPDDGTSQGGVQQRRGSLPTFAAIYGVGLRQPQLAKRVLGTFRYPCLRAGHAKRGAQERIGLMSYRIDYVRSFLRDF